jgi:hypothetical protein
MRQHQTGRLQNEGMHFMYLQHLKYPQKEGMHLTYLQHLKSTGLSLARLEFDWL